MSRHVIKRLGHKGDGIAPGPIYAARTLPGEEIEGDLRDDRIEAPRILTPSPERVTPDCPHYETCGGCALMHADDAFVAGWKADVVRRALAAQGLDAPIKGSATSPENTRRRATLSARRGKKGGLVGFHARGSGTISRIDACRVLRPQILEALPAVEALVQAGASRKGELSVTVTHGPAGIDVAARDGKMPDRALSDTLAAIAGEHDLARLSWNGESVATARPPYQKFGGVRVVPPPGAFLQATEEGERALIAAVSRALGSAGRVADLFSGCGTFALPVSRRVQVHAVEGDADLLAALAAGWRHGTDHQNVSSEVRDLARRPLEPEALNGFDAVVIDPPRAGAEAQMHALAASGVPRVASISCNPVTFARDASILKRGGFEIEWIRIVDQFRWSPHVEIAACLVRR